MGEQGQGGSTAGKGHPGVLVLHSGAEREERGPAAVAGTSQTPMHLHGRLWWHPVGRLGLDGLATVGTGFGRGPARPGPIPGRGTGSGVQLRISKVSSQVWRLEVRTRLLHLGFEGFNLGISEFQFSM